MAPEKKVITLKHGVFLKIIHIVGILISVYGIVVSYPNETGTGLAFIVWFIFTLFSLHLHNQNVIFDKETITYKAFTGKPKTITWQDIYMVKGHPLYEGLTLVGKDGTNLYTVNAHHKNYRFFGSYLLKIRNDLFDSDIEQTFHQKTVFTLLIILSIIAGIFLFWKGFFGICLGSVFIIVGFSACIVLPRRLTMTPEKLILKYLFNTYELYPRAITLRIEQSFANFSYSTSFIPKTHKRRIFFHGLFQSTALRYIYLKNWWEARVPYLIIPHNQKDYEPCECCGNVKRSVWGDIKTKGEVTALYYAHWTMKRPDHGAYFEIILGKWGESTSAEGRHAVSLAYRIHQGQPQYKVLDSQDHLVINGELVGTALSREQVIDTPLAKKVYDMVDEIVEQDPRIAELHA